LYSGAKSISSAQYFGDDAAKKDPEKDARLMKFAGLFRVFLFNKRWKLVNSLRNTGSQAISSADYFDRDETEDLSAGDLARRIAYSATTDLGSLKSIVYDGSKKVRPRFPAISNCCNHLTTVTISFE